MCEKQDTETPESTGESSTTDLALAVDLSCFSPEEVTRLVAARDTVEQGIRNEDPTVYRRLRFVRWLHAQGQLAG